MNAPGIATLRDFCALIGVKQSYGAELKKTGRLVLADDGKSVLVPESIARIAATRDPSKAGVAARHAQERGADADTGHADAAQPAPPAAETAVPNDGEQAGVVHFGYDYQGSKAKKEHFAALEAEASYRQKIAQLLEAAEVRSVLAEVVTVLRTSIEGLPYNLAPQLAATSDEVQVKALLHAEVEHALATAADSLAKLGRGEV